VPGTVKLVKETGNKSGRSLWVTILEREGYAVSEHGASDDMMYEYTVYMPYEMKDPSYFQECLDMESGAALFNCLWDWQTGDCLYLDTGCDGGPQG